MRWDENIEGPVKLIAESNDPLLCVQAGPGTGKSLSIKRKVMRLLQEGVEPESIFACTFTNVAANDLKKTILGTEMPNASKVVVGTIHSYCFSVLNQNSVFAHIQRHTRPLLDYELHFLCEDLKGGHFGNKKSVERRIKRFEAAWATRENEIPGWPTDPVDKAFQVEVITWLTMHKGMLLGELVPLTLDFFRSNPHLPELTQFAYIFVDEYQDLNKSEQELIRLISKASHLMIVGDPNQAIYTFKGAHPDGIRNYPNENPGTKAFPLTVCRRCPKRVVRMANELITKNTSKSSTVLKQHDENSEGAVHIINWQTDEEETLGIAQLIKEHIEKKDSNPGDIIVLSPIADLAKNLSNRLSEIGVEHRNYFSDVYKLHPANVNDNKPLIALSMLNLIKASDDLVAWRCLLGYGEPGLLNEAWRTVMLKSKEQNKNPLEILDLITEGKEDFPKKAKLISRYEQINSELRQLKDLSLKEAFETLFPISEGWAEPFHEAVIGVDFEIVTPGDLAEKIDFFLDKKETPTNVDYVRIMSLHKSKGLTVPITIIIGFIEGLIPGTLSDQITDENELKIEEEEKRRVFYVGITRPTEMLVLSSFTWLDNKIAYHHRVKSKRFQDNRVLTYTSTYKRDFGSEAPEEAEKGNEFLEKLGLST